MNELHLPLTLLSTIREFPLGTAVRKIRGSNWTGKVVGYYTTELTPYGLAIESSSEKGSVQIYPIAAIEKITHDNFGDGPEFLGMGQRMIIKEEKD